MTDYLGPISGSLPDASTRYMMAMAEAGYPMADVVPDSEGGGVYADIGWSVPEDQVRASWKAHQVARTSRSEQFDSYEEYRTWFLENNPLVEIVECADA